LSSLASRERTTVSVWCASVGEGIEPTHHPGGLDRVGVGGCKNSLVAVTVVTAVGVGSAGRVVAVAVTDTGDRGEDGDESSIGEARVYLIVTRTPNPCHSLVIYGGASLIFTNMLVVIISNIALYDSR